ncbi:O-antigen polymerase [Lactiplantibacillus plantarum]|uniref:O-antigen polymerase n=1 Tax=Lactiplantibacillus plantarum TaxID=1590 RepID=UPI003F52F39B
MSERLLFSVGCLVLLIVCMAVNKLYLKSDFIEPAMLFVTFWCLMIGIGIVVLNFNYSYSGLFYILVTCLMTFVITSPIKFFMLNISVKKKNIIFNVKRSRVILFITTLLGDAFAVVSLHSQGVSISQILDFSSLMNVNNQVAVMRYSGTTQTGGIAQILLVFEYLAPIVGGYHAGSSNQKKEKRWGLISLTPTLFTMSTQNTKSGWIAAVTLFIFSLIIAKILDNSFTRIKTKNVLSYFFIGVGIVILLFSSMILRVGEFSILLVQQLWTKFLVYAFGNVPVFDYWFNNRNITTFDYGSNTFLGIMNFLGIRNRAQGVYSTPVYVENFSSNIYTVFRGCIQDFSIIGSILFIVVLISLGCISFLYLKNKRGIYINSFILLNVYFFIMQSFLISPWTYSSYMISLVLFIPYLMIVRNKYRDNKNKE